MKPPSDRRQFLKTAAATAALPVGLNAAAPSPPQKTAGAALPTRVLGKTGVDLPILGFGGAALPRAWGSPLSTADRVKLVRHVFDRGVRYFDDRFHLLCIGMRRPQDLEANLETLTRHTTYTATDQALLEEFGEKAFQSEVIKKMRVD